MGYNSHELVIRKLRQFRPEVVVFQVRCPLGHILEISHEHIGQRLMCPMCQAVVHVSPVRPGETPSAKYEVQCSKKHILRVKQKYLGKEIRCPSCQELVSMKASMLLTSSGETLGMAKPEAFKKKTVVKKPKPPVAETHTAPPLPPIANRITPAPPLPPIANRITPASVPSAPTVHHLNLPGGQSPQRIPPPPAHVVEGLGDSSRDVPPPLMAEIVEETFELSALPVPSTSVPSDPTVIEEDQEFEVVDTQFHLELQESGVDVEKAPPLIKKSSSGRIAPPPPRQLVPPPMAELDDDQDLPPDPSHLPPRAPTGLQNLSASEMMKVQKASLSDPETHIIQVTCPSGHLLQVEKQHRGMHIQCPLCKIIFELPLE